MNLWGIAKFLFARKLWVSDSPLEGSPGFELRFLCAGGGREGEGGGEIAVVAFSRRKWEIVRQRELSQELLAILYTQ